MMKLNLKISFLFLFLFACTFWAQAKVKLPTFISDGMVLQRGQLLSIWGTADANEIVVVTFLKKKYQTVAGVDGKWLLKIPPLKAGGPYTMSINDIQIKNILLGDVFLCSGQSNMELPISRVMDLYRAEVMKDSNSMIRYNKIPLDYNFHSPQDDVKPCLWKDLTPQNALSFSAVAYFFAKDLYAKTKIPIGIINSSVGGSPIEAWISEEGLKSFPQYLNDKRQYESDDYVNSIKKVENQRQSRWNNILYQQDEGLHGALPWYSEKYDDSSWKTVNMFSLWGSDGVNPVNGSYWFRKDFEVPNTFVGKDAVLRLGCIVDADSVYVNGVFVGTVAYRYPPRIYTIPANLLKAGKNNITIRLISYGGFPSFVEGKPYKIIISGGKEINLVGEWKCKRGAMMPDLPGQTFFQYKPVGLYNAMIAPFLPYKVSGVIWYQGESNTSEYNKYGALLTSLISDWRSKWNAPELPFIIVQLPNFMQSHSQPVNSNWAQLRNQQFIVSRTVPHTALVVAIDLGESNDIHPLHKKDVGHRISLQAQKIVYGNERLVTDGPVYQSVSADGNKLILSFNPGTNNLQPISVLKGFAIAGKDGVFKWAKARIDGNKVIVWNDEIENPVKVRYGWDDNPIGINLTNKAGLPASPFTTE